MHSLAFSACGLNILPCEQQSRSPRMSAFAFFHASLILPFTRSCADYTMSGFIQEAQKAIFPTDAD
jgi:hypothetical protein